MENFSNVVNQGKYASFTAVTHPTAPIFRSSFTFHLECAFQSCFTLNYANQFVTHYNIFIGDFLSEYKVDAFLTLQVT